MQGSCLSPLVITVAAMSQSVTDADPFVSDFEAWPIEHNQEVHAVSKLHLPLFLPLLAISARARALRAQTKYRLNCFGGQDHGVKTCRQEFF